MNGFFVSAGHKSAESMAKIEPAVSLTSVGFLGSIDIKFDETGKQQQQQEQMLWWLTFKCKITKNHVGYLLNTHQSLKTYCAWFS